MELSPAKRSKGSSNIYTSVSCLVDECTTDLSHCREYHRRHKVCEQHSKAPKVVIGGLDQRFCQQCSRFHTLVEFDEVKRSCRKRLDVHNQRRRKSQLGSLTRAAGTVVSSQQGTKIMSHNSPQLHPSATMESNWVKLENPITSFENQPVNYIGRPNVYLESSSYSAMTNHGGSNHFRGFECEQSLATTNINRAFSLLSSPRPLSQQTSITMQPVPCGLDYYAFVQEMDIKYALCDSNGLEGVFHEDQD